MPYRTLDPKAYSKLFSIVFPTPLTFCVPKYAQAAWALPSGLHKTNLLIFPFDANNLVCAAFPTTGIPELPKPLMASFSPDVAAQLQRLTLDQRGALRTAAAATISTAAAV